MIIVGSNVHVLKISSLIEDFASCHATSSCVAVSAYSSNFDLRSRDLAKIDTDGTFVFLFPGLSSKKLVQEKRGRTSMAYNARIVYYTALNPEGNLIV